MNNAGNSMELVNLSRKIYQKILKEVIYAYHNGNVDEVLKKYELEDEVESHFYYDSNYSKIMVIADNTINKHDLEQTAKKHGVDPKRIEFMLDYAKHKNYNFGKFRNNMEYSDVLIAAVPHNVKGKDESSSFIAMVKKNPEEYPKVIEMRNANGLKITKQTFLEALLKTRLYSEINI